MFETIQVWARGYDGGNVIALALLVVLVFLAFRASDGKDRAFNQIVRKNQALTDANQKLSTENAQLRTYASSEAVIDNIDKNAGLTLGLLEQMRTDQLVMAQNEKDQSEALGVMLDKLTRG